MLSSVLKIINYINVIKIIIINYIHSHCPQSLISSFHLLVAKHSGIAFVKDERDQTRYLRRQRNEGAYLLEQPSHLICAMPILHYGTELQEIRPNEWPDRQRHKRKKKRAEASRQRSSGQVDGERERGKREGRNGEHQGLGAGSRH